MPRKIRLVSGLRTPSHSDELLKFFLQREGWDTGDTIGTLENFEFSKTREKQNFVFVLPIFGDNDLLLEHTAVLEPISSHCLMAGCRVVIVLKGDRHVNDEFVLEQHTAKAKLKKIFHTIEATSILKTKLDQDTAERIADEISSILNTKTSNFRELDLLTQLLGDRPFWAPQKKQISFYNEARGISLLQGVSSEKIDTTARILKTLAPFALEVNNSHFKNKDIAPLSQLSSLKAVQLGSNNLSIEFALSTFKYCRWISIAANGVSSLDLSLAHPNLSSLLAQKNNIRDINIESNSNFTLKRLSLYRNKIEELPWPKSQEKIETINIGANPIKMLPEQLANAKNLRFIGLARTHIKTLPEWIFHLPLLKEIDISHIEDTLPSSQIKKAVENGIKLTKKPA